MEDQLVKMGTTDLQGKGMLDLGHQMKETENSNEDMERTNMSLGIIRVHLINIHEILSNLPQQIFHNMIWWWLGEGVLMTIVLHPQVPYITMVTQELVQGVGEMEVEKDLIHVEGQMIHIGLIIKKETALDLEREVTVKLGEGW